MIKEGVEENKLEIRNEHVLTSVVKELRGEE